MSSPEARAHGEALFSASIRSQPEDFRVTEQLGFEPDGDGEHALLLLEKVSTNTEWLARQLARFAGVNTRDVGYCGLKDRHAVCRQWFSVYTRSSRPDWSGLEIDGVRLIRASRHRRKLRRGAHRGNHFRIRLDRLSSLPSTAELVARVDVIRARGVPNYFGRQRFGHNGENLELAAALFGGAKLRRDKRGFAISAARAKVFNAVLNHRVRTETWERILPGELANLDGSGSVFAVPVVDDEIDRRVREFDIHPTGPLWGTRTSSETTAEVAGIEAAVAAECRTLTDGLCAVGASAAVRPLRVRPSALTLKRDERSVELTFWLPRGAFATALLAEIAEVEDAAAARPSAG